jgi:hypothetical protein
MTAQRPKAHWSKAYLGRPFSAAQDCFYWFCRIQAEVFDRQIPAAPVDPGRPLASAARLMRPADAGAPYGFVATGAPVDGDAVFLSRRTRPHHIGTVAVIDRARHVVHALEGRGVVISDALELRTNGWQVAGYFTCK